MKKTALITFGFFLMAGMPLTADYHAGLKGSYFSSENAIFRDVYGSVLKLGIEGGLDIAKNLAVFADLDYLHKTGKLTVTAEETKVRITPLTVGARYKIPAGEKMRFYAGLGIQEVFFKEEASIGTTKENGLGLVAIGGGMYQLTEKIGAGLFLSWSTCKLSHANLDFKVGGLDIGAGVDLRF